MKSLTFFLYCFFLFILPSDLWAIKSLGTIGAVYHIEEPDLMKEIEQAVANFDEKKYKEKTRNQIFSYQPKDISKLPRSKKTQTRIYTPIAKAPFDIPDDKGNIIYPKGFEFYPLASLPYFGTYSVLDATNTKQLRWYKAHPWYQNIETKILLTDGAWNATSTTLNRPVYYLTEELAKRLGVQVTPTLIQRSPEDPKSLILQEFNPESFQ